ncbi:SDR family oxidoreductase [Streptacidiphilus sp. P02-A3a]|uniref:SDR family oxidoreductase n=1 Tax=Streptacidiphilus sp. P02-A3a TaxID=2704468 RepID=UPI0015FC59B6|nr:SDR family oxidoreductase [Streptacidiphilus sp. P02-A3a]QMU69268.1 SDR family oxidoreductase [Streptacidiphilus sp. P02-A3a]
MTQQDSGAPDPAAAKVTLVTGASRGIGLAVARALVARGERVVITGRDQASLEQAVKQLGAESALGVAGKSHDEAHRAETVERALEHFGRIDALVNNVGTNPVFGSMLELDLSTARKILDINLVSTLGWVQLVHRAALAEHGGVIVNVSSVGGLGPAPGIGMYGASKAALIQLTQQLAYELAPSVRVNAVAPAVVRTKFAEALFAGHEEQVAQAYPLKRLGVPEDVGSAVAFLLSDEASWITGQTLVLDGGVTLNSGIG